MISFRVGADDAAYLGKYFAPQFEPQDIMQLHNRHFVATMTLDGEKTQPFSGSTLQIPVNPSDFTDQIVENSRSDYAHTKAEVEHLIDLQTRPMQKQHVPKVPASLLQQAAISPEPTKAHQPEPAANNLF